MTTTTVSFDTDISDCDLTPKVVKILKDNEITNVRELTDKTQKQLKSIKGLGSLGSAEILIFLKKNRLRMAPEVKKIDPLLDFKKKLVFKYLKDPNQANFGRELKAANALLQVKPVEFWENFTLNFKLNSLYFFLSQRGKEIIFEASIKKKELPTIEETTTELSESKLGTDIVCNKPKSIKDFLNGR